MTTKELDPIYGHIVGPSPCKAPECKGHKETWSATIHVLHLEYYGTTRRRNKVKRKQKAESVRIGAKTERKRLKKINRKRAIK